MRANAAVREPQIQEAFESIYDWQRSGQDTGRQTAHRGPTAKRDSPPTFVIHDGPPFANGPPHMGHALNKILKDIVTRYRILKGYRVSFVPGWDCHGLPIELKALDAVRKEQKKLAKKKKRNRGAEAAALELGPDGAVATAQPTAPSIPNGVLARQESTAVSVRQAAMQFALGAIEEQAAAFKRWGVLGDWQRPYKTMDPEYEVEQLQVFYNMYKNGLIFRGFKPVYWSPSSKTALAEAELECVNNPICHYVRSSWYATMRDGALCATPGTNGSNFSLQ